MRSKKFYLRISLLFISVSFSSAALFAQQTLLSENFDVVVPTGWTAINHSSKSGFSWAQGDIRFINGANSGISNSYAGAGYFSLGTSGNGTISNWLITPELNFQNASSLSFYTRTVFGSTVPDRLEVRLSTNGASTDIGSGAEGTGDFSTLLLTINGDLEVGGFPDTNWTQYLVGITGVSGTGRIAFRYYVTDGGSQGANSFYIGLDDVSFESVLPVSLFGFKGVVKNNAAFLTWSTASELNNKGFEVQMSRDNKNFSAVGFVKGYGNSSIISSYSFTDNEKLLSGTSYYRLRQVDMDGTSRLSQVVKLDFKNSDWKIYGNPSSNAWISLQVAEETNVAVQVVSMNGQVIQLTNKGKLATGTYTIPLNLQNTARGIYTVRLLRDGNADSKKLLR